jgi:hypothetical protein
MPVRSSTGSAGSRMAERSRQDIGGHGAGVEQGGDQRGVVLDLVAEGAGPEGGAAVGICGVDHDLVRAAHAARLYHAGNAQETRLLHAGRSRTSSGPIPTCSASQPRAQRRGIAVEVIEELEGHLALNHDGRPVRTRGALSELASAVAMTYCPNKRMTRQVLTAAGLRIPPRVATFDEEDTAFLDEVGQVVVKPVDGEQGVRRHGRGDRRRRAGAGHRGSPASSTRRSC